MMGLLVFFAILAAFTALGVFLAEMRDRPHRRAMDLAEAEARRA